MSVLHLRGVLCKEFRVEPLFETPGRIIQTGMKFTFDDEVVDSPPYSAADDPTLTPRLAWSGPRE